MEYVDKKYINLLSSKLRNFKWKSEKLANFSCPICGDSANNTKKSRGYLFPDKNIYMFKCHNCSYSSSFSWLLKKLDDSLHNQYTFENFKESNSITDIKKADDKPIESMEDYYANAFSKKHLKMGDIRCVTQLNSDHVCKKYLDNRKIPNKYHGILYYAANFKKWAETTNFLHTENLVEDARLVIPFFDKTGKTIVAIQGRSLDPKCKLRYITLKISENQKLIYGLERLNYSNPIYVTEGPLDSLFIPNCVAMATAGKTLDFPKETTTLIYDNEPRNVQIVSYMQKAIDDGYRVCFWPASIQAKDVNEMVQKGLTPDQVFDIIRFNSCLGLMAKLKLQTWRKC